MKAISFLGTGNYNEVTYIYQDKKVCTKYFPYAFWEFMKPNELYIVMTDKAEKSHKSELKKLCAFESVRIPDGKSENEIWEIFGKIVSVFNENDEIVIDITHGFRSIPLVVIASLIYLKSLKNVKIKSILYGVFEAKNELNETPVFDLKPFLDIIDWSYAINEFLKNGNSKNLNLILQNIQKLTFTQNEEFRATKLQPLGKKMEEISNSVSLANIREVFNNINFIPDLINSVVKDVSNIPRAKPFGMLLDKINSRFIPLSGISDDNLFSSEGINAQIEIIQWCIEIEKYQQAITLMNELFISYHCIKLNKNPLVLKEREEVNKMLGEYIVSLKEKTLGEKLIKTADLKNKLSELRNEINHAGMRENNTPSSRIIENIKIYFNVLKNYIREENKI